jgi:glyoxylase-like metal-dependent hydrolase (beta-lactamase superfamily II)
VHLECDDEIIDVIDLGPAHSPNDIVVYFEKRQVLAAGDLIWVNMHPVLLDGNTNLRLWKSYLDKLERDFKIKVVVPGHGDLSGRGAILNMKGYFNGIEGALDDSAKMKELKGRYRTYKKFPVFGSLHRTAKLLEQEKRRSS